MILGGTAFLGRHIVESARASGHRVTLFNRGKTNPELFPDVERLRGDRDGDLRALEGRRFDAVIDTCGYVPRVVHASVELLARGIGHYTFISSVSVYAEEHQLDADESAPLATMADPAVEEITGETYGPLKALCEHVVADVMGERALVVRPGLIVGPHDPTDRFTYWPRRVARGGDVLAPGDPGRLVQVIDARDLAAWCVRCAETGTAGTWNAVGDPIAFGALLDQCAAFADGGARFVWVEDAFLLEAGVAPWTELPLWIPDADMTVANARARASGLTFRTLASTIRDTLAWDRSRAPGTRAGLTREKEEELLRAWRARSG